MHEGSRKWFIPDGFWHSRSNGVFPSHEAICVLNTGKNTADIEVTLFFEDREKMDGFRITVQGERTRHIRMDRMLTEDGHMVPIDIPYAMVVESSVPIIVQYTRMDTSQAEMALMTTIAYTL